MLTASVVRDHAAKVLGAAASFAASSGTKSAAAEQSVHAAMKSAHDASPLFPDPTVEDGLQLSALRDRLGERYESYSKMAGLIEREGDTFSAGVRKGRLADIEADIDSLETTIRNIEAE